MFAPAPLGTDAWFTAPGTLESGERVDAFQGGSFDWEKPPDVSSTYPSARWRKYLTNLQGADAPELSSQFAGYLCERWDARNDATLRNVSVYAVLQPTRLDGRSRRTACCSSNGTVAAEWRCSPGAAHVSSIVTRTPLPWSRRTGDREPPRSDIYFGTHAGPAHSLPRAGVRGRAT